MKRALGLIAFGTVSSCLLPSVDLREQASASGGNGGMDGSISGATETEAGGAGRSGHTSGGTSDQENGGSSDGGRSAGGTGGKQTDEMSAGDAGESGADSGGTSTGGSTRGGGSSSGAGGTPAGASGGGAAGSSAGAGGKSGTAGSGASGGAPNLLPIVGSWDGALLTYGCGTSSTGYDCQEPASAGCIATATGTPSLIPSSNGAASSWTIGGTAGATYNVTVRIRGIVEVNSYVGGTRDAGDASISVSLDLFQQGGSPPGPGALGFDYNTYEIDVTPPVAGAANTYFLNSVAAAENPHATGSPTRHITYPIDYTKTIKVTGGGQVQVKATDSNCAMTMNCGPTTSSGCLAPRTVNLTGSTPAAPASFVQPFAGAATNTFGEWLFFDVSGVTLAQ